MCTVDDSELNGDVFIPDDEKLELNGEFEICRRCERSASVRLRKKDVYCRTCFLETTAHKFRSTLGKSKKMRASDSVLVAFSGSPSSVALLHMLWKGKQQDQHKKIHFNVVSCYIDDGALLKEKKEERLKTVVDIQNYVQSLGIPLYVTTLSQSLFPEKVNLSTELKIDEKDDAALEKLFQGTKSLTSKEDLLLKLRDRLLMNIAKELNCNRLFTAEDQTTLAIKLMTNVALGRGEHLRFDVGFKDARCDDVMVLRPLVDIERKEIAFYNKFYNIEAVKRSSLTTSLSANTSIRRLTEQFIVGLHSSFRSTVSTVYRTGEKLSANPASINEGDNLCILCRGSFRNELPHYSVVDAKATSTSMCRPNSDKMDDSSSSCCGGNPSCSSKKEKLDLTLSFCYGCQLIVKELDTIDVLPRDILEQMKQRQNLSAMREQISDFLL